MPFQSTLDKSVRPKIRHALMLHLYYQENEAMRQTLRDIIQENCTIEGHTLFGFHYMFMWYDLGSVPGAGYSTNPPGRGVHIPLHRSLHERMDAWLANKRKVEKEEQHIVIGYFTAVLNMSDSAYDWLKLLPDEVHKPIHDQRAWGVLTNIPPPILTNAQVEAFYQKQERFLNVLKGRLALNLIF